MRWLGDGKLDTVADKFMQAIENVTGNPETRTRDMGGSARTREVTEAVCREVERVCGGGGKK